MKNKKQEDEAALTDTVGYPFIEVLGAREHNLKNVHVRIPRNQLVVITGISGSGKSSLAFDTIYAEGQRRYMESFSAYARSFIGSMERPDVDQIVGLSPVISIEQKTTGRNPRSTVGTVTEIYDFFRLLYARASQAYSYVSGKRMERQSEEEIIGYWFEHFNTKKMLLLAPLVRGRKGHYRELFEQVRKSGYSRVRVDGELLDLVPKMQVDRYKVHDIELVVDSLQIIDQEQERIQRSLKTALKQGQGVVMAMVQSKSGEFDAPRFFSKNLMDMESGIAYDEPAPNMFSFNSPYGACPTCKGLGELEELTEGSIIPDPTLSVSRGGLLPLGEYRDTWIFRQLEALFKKFGQSISTPIAELPAELKDIMLYGGSKSQGAKVSFEGIFHFLNHYHEEGSDRMQDWIREYMEVRTCPECEGARLKKESLYFKVDERNIAELTHMSLSELAEWCKGLEKRLPGKDAIIASEIMKEIRKRLGFLLDVGLDYLTLDRSMRTLSGGESQRIRLATQIGTQLVGVLYILDEPSIGLHQRDNEKLIKALKELRDLGNSVLVVEHDRDMMMASDYLIDIGPGAGRHGGSIVAEGPPAMFSSFQGITADYLAQRKEIPWPNEHRALGAKRLVLKGATGHNLRNVDLELPLGNFICITGVSGSGKSSLIHDTLYPILKRHFYNSRQEPLPYVKIDGLEHIDKVIEVDQAPIGRTPRSNPATYTEVFGEIRQLFALLPEAKIRGYKAGRFSFNVKGGRCETCEGGGVRVIEMDFLPDVHVLCETCKGKRYNRETLEVRYKGKSIADVLDMTVEQAGPFFEAYPKIVRKMEALRDVGLGYLTLGQHATTLSGGEAQRVKLATELAKKDTGRTLYILDEPTTGLHFQDISYLLGVLNKLVDKGNTVLVIEHHMDVIKTADFLVDMGPEGGKEGGDIMFAGSPTEMLKKGKSHTARFLRLEHDLRLVE